MELIRAFLAGFPEIINQIMFAIIILGGGLAFFWILQEICIYAIKRHDAKIIAREQGIRPVKKFRDWQ